MFELTKLVRILLLPKVSKSKKRIEKAQNSNIFSNAACLVNSYSQHSKNVLATAFSVLDKSQTIQITNNNNIQLSFL